VDPRLIWMLVAIAVVVVAGVAWYMTRRRRSDVLRERFGPEYERTVQATGDVKRAEASLEARARRVEALHIRPLAAGEAERFGSSWRGLQERFVDDPKGAVTEADRLVGEVMHARGYPLGEFDQRVEDISVDHPNVVMNYRAARQIANAHARGEASTEDLRQAMVHYRALFSDLLETDDRERPATGAYDENIMRGRR
jgi:hypothetical protein